MAVSPNELLKLTPDELNSIERLETFLDQELRKGYSGEGFLDIDLEVGAVISLEKQCEPSRRVMVAIKRKYKDAGWDRVEFVSEGGVKKFVFVKAREN